MTIYMAVTADKYELPLFISESFSEMARILGIDKSTVWRQFAEGRTSIHPYCGYKYKVIKLELEE